MILNDENMVKIYLNDADFVKILNDKKMVKIYLNDADFVKFNTELHDSSILINWTSPFPILGVLGVFCHFHSFFK